MVCCYDSGVVALWGRIHVITLDSVSVHRGFMGAPPSEI